MPSVSRQIDLSEQDSELFEAAWRMEGMKQKDLIARLIHWFVKLDRPARQLVLGTLPRRFADEVAQELAARAIEVIEEVEPSESAASAGSKPEARANPPPAKHRGRMAS